MALRSCDMLRHVKLAFHDADTDTDTDTDFLTRILSRKSRVSEVRMYRRVGRVGVGIGVRVGVVECQLYNAVQR